MSENISEATPIQHVVIIPDGDRRWAVAHGLPVWEGHRRGTENIRMILDVCKERNIPYVSMWGFSTENWRRSGIEVENLLRIILDGLKREHQSAIKNEVCFRHIGRKDRLPADLLAEIMQTEEDTKQFTKWHFQAAIDYGGRDEIIRAVKKITEEVKAGNLDINTLDEVMLSQYLDTAGIPDPDLIIRTSGEQRLSGMMPYQGVYAELAFVDLMFPDFTKKAFNKVLDDFLLRNRRHGK